jgi:hypothetical protein
MAIYISVKFKIEESVKYILNWVNTDLNENYGIVWHEMEALHTRNVLGDRCSIDKDYLDEKITIVYEFGNFNLRFLITNSDGERQEYLFESTKRGDYCYYRGRKAKFFKSSFLPKLTPNFHEYTTWNYNVNIFMDEEEDYFQNVSSQILFDLYSKKNEL